MTVILLLRFLIFPESAASADWQKTTATVLDNLLAATVTSLFIGTAYLLLFPSVEDESVEVVQTRDIKELIQDALRASNSWAIRARTASYFARETLPQIRDSALATGRSVAIRMQVIDPSNSDLLGHYARYRSNRPGAAAEWTADRARVEIYSSVLAAALVSAEAPRVDISVGFSSDFWVLSLDLADELALVTGQNKNEPALCIRRRSPLFGGWREDFDAGYSVCRVIRPELCMADLGVLKERGPEALTVIRQLFANCGLPDLPEAQLNDILRYSERSHNYA